MKHNPYADAAHRTKRWTACWSHGWRTRSGSQVGQAPIDAAPLAKGWSLAKGPAERPADGEHVRYQLLGASESGRPFPQARAEIRPPGRHDRNQSGKTTLMPMLNR